MHVGHELLGIARTCMSNDMDMHVRPDSKDMLVKQTARTCMLESNCQQLPGHAYQKEKSSLRPLGRSELRGFQLDY